MATIINTADIARMTNLTPNETDWVYNGLDCCVTLEVLHSLRKNLDPISQKTYQFSLDLQAPVFEMSLRGMKVNTVRRDKVLKDCNENIRIIANNLNRIFSEGIGLKLNWRSPTQLSKFFYDVMGYKEIKKRSATTGRYSRTTNREALEQLSSHYLAEPICNHLLLLRDYDKQRQFLETPLDPDGCFRSGYNIAGTNTGRLSSSISEFGTGNNAQNIARDLRSTFRARPGYKMANLDLEQADARNIGAICWNLFVGSHGPEFAGAYLDACESGDLHTFVCRMAWTHLDWPEDAKGRRAVADEIFYRNNSFRDTAKTLGHATNYISTVSSIAKKIHMPFKPINDFQINYFGAFPCIPEWHKNVAYQLKTFGTLTTLHFDRRRHFFGRATDDATIREAAAFEPQSMTADEIDTGIIELWKSKRVHLLAQVHDNILFEYPEDEEAEIIPWALKTLETPIQLKQGRTFIVPTEAKIGWNWGDENKDNPHGLIKWTGSDTRQPPVYKRKKKLSIWDL